MQVKIDRQTFRATVRLEAGEIPGIAVPMIRTKILIGRERVLAVRDAMRKPGEPCPFRIKLKVRMEKDMSPYLGFRLVERNAVDDTTPGRLSADDATL